jgi:cell fate regulator YaaT (PSP1 superfamily)
MNVFDWLANLPFSDPESTCKVIEVSFNNGSRKDYYRNTTNLFFEKGEPIAVEGVSGFDVGNVNLTGELVRLQLKKYNVKEDNPEMRKVLRRATESDLQRLRENKAREMEVMIRSRAIARQLKLEMKVAQVEVQADGRKATFFYIADDRVDFRELIKIYATEFKVKVEMRQIGARQEAGKVGGIGSCGRELCCSTWLTEFKSVNTNAARYQNLSINQIKLSGQCGRLKCCLNFELDTYLDALQQFPDNCESIEIARGRAFLVKKDIFRNLMWYTLPDSNKQYPLTLDRVKKIKALNQQGIKPEELEAVEVVSKKPVEVEPAYADVVGQISLRSLERTSRKRREQERGPRGGGDQRDQRGQQRGPQRGGGQSSGNPSNRGQQPRNTGGGGDQRAPQRGGGQPSGGGGRGQQPRGGADQRGQQPRGGGAQPNRGQQPRNTGAPRPPQQERPDGNEPKK